MDTVRLALSGDETAVRALVDSLTPVIQARVARTLCRNHPTGPARDVRQEVQDLVQEVFVSLFENDARVLRSWQPERGLSLDNFVGLVAERQAASILRSGRRSPWTEEAQDMALLDELPGDVDGPEDHVASREVLRALLGRVRESLSPRGLELFHRLMVQREEVPSICASTQMSPDSVYAWRSRLGKLVRRLMAEMEQGP
jgi:RNA polymerase sigma-70 factor (ECF subfamily)